MYAACQILQVDLVYDAEARRHHAECIECLHAPFHELVAFVVALEFQFHIEIERFFLAIVIDLHRVIDHQIDGHERFDVLRIFAHLRGDAAHCSQVGQERNTGEVLQHYTRHDEWNFISALRGRAPIRELLYVFFSDFLAVTVTQYRFQHDADRYRQTRNVHAEFFFQRR